MCALDCAVVAVDGAALARACTSAISSRRDVAASNLHQGFGVEHCKKYCKIIAHMSHLLMIVAREFKPWFDAIWSRTAP